MTEYTDTWVAPSSGLAIGGLVTNSSCLSIDEVLSFAQGQLEDDELQRVHGHVDQCELCQRLVSEGVHALDCDPLAESAPASWNTVFQPNTVVGRRYRIRRLVARGGMGEVYEAYDTELQERLALKTVTSTACDSLRALKCLKAEVQLTRRISHPNVCRIYDFGTHGEASSGHAIYFLAMEYVDGECLGKRLRDTGALPVTLSISIARQILLGLRAAHEAGVLHRDLKSDNVMLRTDANGRLVPVILDFGLAKALNDSGLATSTLMQDHGIIGTVGYMAPEQVEGRSLSVASDLYAFGVVWFEMLTGKLPFSGDSAAAAAMARLLRAPAPPSSINPAVPKWLDEIVLRCLSRRTHRRFRSAQTVLDALSAATLVPRARRTSLASWWLLLPLASGVTALGLSSLPRQRAARAELLPTQSAQWANSSQSNLRTLRLPLAPKDMVATESSSRLPRRSRNPRYAIPSSATPLAVQPPALAAERTGVPESTRTTPQKKPRWLPIWSTPPQPPPQSPND